MRLRAPPAPSPPPHPFSPPALTSSLPSSPHPYLASHLVRAAPRFGLARVWPRAPLQAVARAPLSSPAVACPLAPPSPSRRSSVESRRIFFPSCAKTREGREKKQQRKRRLFSLAVAMSTAASCRFHLVFFFFNLETFSAALHARDDKVGCSWQLTRMNYLLRNPICCSLLSLYQISSGF